MGVVIDFVEDGFVGWGNEFEGFIMEFGWVRYFKIKVSFDILWCVVDIELVIYY